MQLFEVKKCKKEIHFCFIQSYKKSGVPVIPAYAHGVLYAGIISRKVRGRRRSGRHNCRHSAYFMTGRKQCLAQDVTLL